MKKPDYKYIYGPVPSWRLGSSLGIDPISRRRKICTFDCVYCQLGKGGKRERKRKVYVAAEKIVREISLLPPVNVDYITFSGRGEPTLAKNLGLMIKAVKAVRKEKIAVLTNAALLGKKDVRQDLKNADFVVAKLDACSQEHLKAVNRPVRGIGLFSILKGIKKFREKYKGKFALQAMFIKENKDDAPGIARLARRIKPDEIQINTPLRPCGAKPLSRGEIDKIAGYFKGMNVVSVYRAARKKVVSISREDTLKRRGKV